MIAWSRSRRSADERTRGGAMIGAWWLGAVALGTLGGDPPPADSRPPQAKAADATPEAAALADYNARRAKAKMTAGAQWGLGLWCEQHGLPAEAAAHFSN